MKIDWTTTTNNAFGHPRYVCHFLNLNSESEHNSNMSISDKYAYALARAKRIGGKKYHNKSYGGGIVFATFSLEELERRIEEALKS